jgi:hypothetical protein
MKKCRKTIADPQSVQPSVQPLSEINEFFPGQPRMDARDWLLWGKGYFNSIKLCIALKKYRRNDKEAGRGQRCW